MEKRTYLEHGNDFGDTLELVKHDDGTYALEANFHAVAYDLSGSDVKLLAQDLLSAIERLG